MNGLINNLQPTICKILSFQRICTATLIFDLEGPNARLCRPTCQNRTLFELYFVRDREMN